MKIPVVFGCLGGCRFPSILWSIKERDLDAGKLAALATSILQDLPTYQRMAKAARALAVPDAADRVGAAIEATLKPS